MDDIKHVFLKDNGTNIFIVQLFAEVQLYQCLSLYKNIIERQSDLKNFQTLLELLILTKFNDQLN